MRHTSLIKLNNMRNLVQFFEDSLCPSTVSIQKFQKAMSLDIKYDMLTIDATQSSKQLRP